MARHEYLSTRRHHASVTVRILAALDGPPPDAWHTTRGVADATGLSVRTVSYRLGVLHRQGRVQHRVLRGDEWRATQRALPMGSG